MQPATLKQHIIPNLFELAAIWTEERVPVGGGATTSRLAPGDTVAVVGNTLVTDNPNPTLTHIVTACFGTINSSVLIVKLADLNTGEPIELRIK